MEDVHIIHTDWYVNKGMTFYAAKGFSVKGEEFCEGYVSKNIFRTRTSMEDCVLFTNKSKESIWDIRFFWKIRFK